MDGGWNAYERGVRPVVILNSNVSVNDIKVINGEETSWTAEGGKIVSSGYLSGAGGKVE